MLNLVLLQIIEVRKKITIYLEQLNTMSSLMRIHTSQIMQDI